ncbi:glycosyltransferase family 4 protein [Patescibacteria group bacterium]
MKEELPKQKKELVIICDTPSTTRNYMKNNYSCSYYLKHFNRVRILYWSKEKNSQISKEKGEKLILYPYCKPYNSGYVTGLKYMVWIAKTLWGICRIVPKDKKLIFMPVIPIWAGLPSLIVSKIKRKKIVLRISAQKINYLKSEEKLENRPQVFIFFKIFILKLIYWITLPFYDFIIGISSGVTNEAKSYGAKKITTIPVSFDIGLFLSKSKKEAPPNKIPIVLYVGQIKKAKGVQDLIEAVKVLKKKFKVNSRLLIVGMPANPKDEKFYRELQKKSRGLDVKFLGWVPHQRTPKIYKKADIFVLPSYSEALGVVIMEAMASGLPVIATKTSGAKELVKNDKTGFLVQIGDAIEIGEKIKTLSENKSLRESMGKAGRKRIEEIMRKVDKEYKKVFKDLEKK